MQTLKISENHFTHLKEILYKDEPLENAAFLLIGSNKFENEVKYLVRRIIEIPENLFIVKNEIHIEISTQAIHGIVRLCEANNLGLALCHSHPFSLKSLDYSPSDDYGEEQINEYFKKILPNQPLISILFGRDKIVGRIWNDNGSIEEIKNLEIIGNTIKKITLTNKPQSLNVVESVYDRQIGAFGLDGQIRINQTKVGIIGIGGTGSIIAEQLVRLGVVDLKIADHDTFDKSNITRMYGSSTNDLPQKKILKKELVPRYKVDIMVKHLQKINPKLNIKGFKENIVYKTTADKFLDRDVIFACTDKHWSRAIINQISFQYLIPVINTGVRLSSHLGKFSAGTIVSHFLGPDKPCLWCYDYLKSNIIYAESIDPSNRKNLINQGYIENIDDLQPSVITYTSLGSCLSMTIFLNLITGYLGEFGNISSLRSDMLQLDIRRGTTNIKENCVCQKVYARGNNYPLYTI